MRPITISLDQITWELAKKKQNFSDWVRNQLRSERNRSHLGTSIEELHLHQRELVEDKLNISTSRLLYELEQRSEQEIIALVSILQGSLSHVSTEPQHIAED